MAIYLIIAGVLFVAGGVFFFFKKEDAEEGLADVNDDVRAVRQMEGKEILSSVRTGQGADLESAPWDSESDFEWIAPTYLEPLYSHKKTDVYQNEMSAILQAGGHSMPTASQWSMILSPKRSTRVIAGAGSGKSTALSLRAVFMHKFLDIPLGGITIVTFTRASRADMVQKLINDMSLFGVFISEDEARKVVRTFHSLLISQSGTGGTFFEQISSTDGNFDETENLGHLSPKQLDFLRQVYAETYKQNRDFRMAVGQVLYAKIAAGVERLTSYSDTEALEKAMAVAGHRDLVVTRAATDAWRLKLDLDSRMGEIVWEPTPIRTSRSGSLWYANGKVLNSGLPVILGCGAIKDVADSPLDPFIYKIEEADKKRSLAYMTNVRLKVVATIATERYLYIETAEDLSDLYYLVDWQLQSNNETFPAFSVRLPGDTSSSSIFECLYTLGSFVASMGVPVASTAAEIAAGMAKTGLTIEANVCKALAVFWPALQGSGHGTYDELFLRYGDPEQVAKLNSARLLPMKHLLVDEFQDISGQIIKWIKAAHVVLEQQGESPSILAVGDDWQSIHGWRGSDPEYMIRFDDHFGESGLITMNENFRCGQQIINVAELLAAGLKETIAQKHGVASGAAAETMGDVFLCDGGDDEIHERIKGLRGEDPDAEIFILSRTNDGLMPFRKWGKSKKVRLMTMHRAKGLEADYVVIKGDCFYCGTSPLKNAIYSRAGMGVSYDLAQQDESLRLAYVSITRARKRVYWYGEPSKVGGAYRLVQQKM